MTVEARVRTAPSVLGRAVIESVAYSDVFDFPVTVAEIHRSLPVFASIAEVESGLDALGDYVARLAPYRVLAGREALVETRLRREEASRRLMRRAGFYGRLISRLPFVRMVAVTGSLAVENADDGDDVDYLIVTAPGRVWLARALTMAVVRFAGLRGLTLCPNYLLTETALALPDRDLYTARELLQMRPVAGHGVHGLMLDANAWCQELLPNWQRDVSDEEARRSAPTKLGELLLGGSFGDKLERWLLARKGRELRAQAAGNREAIFDETMCKGHFDSHRSRLQEALTERLTRLGVQP